MVSESKGRHQTPTAIFSNRPKPAPLTQHLPSLSPKPRFSSVNYWANKKAPGANLPGQPAQGAAAQDYRSIGGACAPKMKRRLTISAAPGSQEHPLTPRITPKQSEQSSALQVFAKKKAPRRGAKIFMPTFKQIKVGIIHCNTLHYSSYSFNTFKY